MTDADFLALTCWGEGRSEPIEGRIAIACVIRNRLKTGRWGATYESVCLAPWQFSCWHADGGVANYHALLTLKAAIEDGHPISDALFLESRWIADGIVAGVVLDRVKHAQHYHVVDMQPVPTWARGQVPVVTIGRHAFYAGIR